jgi:hypothetical protein
LRKVNTSDEKSSKSSSERFSIDVDSEGRELTAEQAEYFKDQSISLLFEKVLLGRNLAVTILSNKKTR